MAFCKLKNNFLVQNDLIYKYITSIILIARHPVFIYVSKAASEVTALQNCIKEFSRPMAKSAINRARKIEQACSKQAASSSGRHSVFCNL